MKKRMQILMSLTLTAFLFLGLTSLNAQSFSTGPTNYAGPNGKTLVDYQAGADAISTIQTELHTNYDLENPAMPTNATDAATYYRMFYLRAVEANVASGEATGAAIFRAYNTTVNAAKVSYPNLIDESWQADMVTLLSN